MRKHGRLAFVIAVAIGPAMTARAVQPERAKPDITLPHKANRTGPVVHPPPSGIDPRMPVLNPRASTRSGVINPSERGDGSGNVVVPK